MKDIQTGEMNGPPLPHDEWIENQRKLEHEEAQATQRRTHVRTAKADDGDTATRHASHAKK